MSDTTRRGYLDTRIKSIKNYLDKLHLETFKPCISSIASCPSALFIKATKPQFLCLLRSSSVRGHMIFTLAIGPNLPKVLNRKFSST